LATRFYLRRAAQTITGTAPATNASLSATAPLVTPGTTNGNATTPLLTNFSLDPNIGVTAQTSLVYTTKAATTNQNQPLMRFVSPPLAAQTIGQQVMGFSLGYAASSTVSVFWAATVWAIWRPSTGGLVGRLLDMPVSPSSGPATASQTVAAVNGGSGNVTPVTCQAGDVLVLELWRNSNVQTMATSYTNTLFYDGTTEGSATNTAAYINFANNIALASDVTEPATPTLGGPAESCSTTRRTASGTTHTRLPRGGRTGSMRPSQSRPRRSGCPSPLAPTRPWRRQAQADGKASAYLLSGT
jgi:hypothetical protein